MIKGVITVCFLLLFGIGYSQTDKTVYFGQCLFSISTEKEVDKLKEEMLANPYVEMVRLDFFSQRAFIITKKIGELSEQDFASWFNNYSETVECIQIGIRGIDNIEPFPFKNCKD